MSNYAHLLMDYGHADLAERLLREALSLVPQDDPLQRAAVLSTLGRTLRRLGRLSEARDTHREALSTWLSQLEETNPKVAEACVNLAGVESDLGAYAEAYRLYDRAGVIWRRLGSAEGIAGLLIARGTELESIGMHAEADALFRRGLQDVRQAGLEKTQGGAVLLDMVGRAALGEKKFDDAIGLFRESMSSFESRGEERDRAVAANSLANALAAKGEVNAALDTLAAARARLTERAGATDPTQAQLDGGQAWVLWMAGRREEALEMANSVVSRLTQSSARVTPQLSDALDVLAGLQAASLRPTQALDTLERVEQFRDSFLTEVFAVEPEGGRRSLLDEMRVGLSAFLSLALQVPPDPRVAGRALDLVLRRKGLDAEAWLDRRRAVLAAGDATLADHLARYLAALRVTDELRLRGAATGEVDAARRERDRIDHEIGDRLLSAGVITKIQAGVAAELPRWIGEGRLLIEIVRFRPSDFSSRSPEGTFASLPPRYVAFFVRGGDAQVTMRDLGDANAIDAAVIAVRSMIVRYDEATTRGEIRTDTVFDRVRRLLDRRGTNGRAASALLQRTVVDPIVEAAGGCRHIFIAPDGELSRFPFASAATVGGRVLLDDYVVSFLTTGRDLMRATPDGAAHSQESSLIVADPDFDLQAAAGDTRSGVVGKPNFQVGRLGRLRGARAEGEYVGGFIGAVPLSGAGAVERAVKQARSPLIVHLATHGFFLAPEQAGGVRDPMLRSGLALAGFNTWVAGKPMPAEAEDGYLNANDLLALNLLGTELAVLSACESGLGAAYAGEGVFGLRRALLIAGVRTALVTLWRVPDLSTMDLMRNFYGRLAKGEGRAEALRGAQLDLRARRRDPRHWAGFALIGACAALPIIDRLTDKRH
ncbi:MAG: CHAT domain-containing tetratricopeptide repeat protein [Chloroflexota bacterium]